MTTTTGTLEEYIELVESYISRGLTDGFPVIPPTIARVDAMVAATCRNGDEVLGIFPPVYREVTIRDVGTYATMAGCLPEYAPVVVAAIEVMLKPSFGLHHGATSTIGNGPLLIVNGPIRNEIGINCGNNVLGPGNRANLTIGRAVRLLMINVGGAIPGLTDFALFGHGGKLASVIGEDEENSPWPPYHVENGFAASDSTVTVMSSGPPRRAGAYVTAQRVELLLLRMAESMSSGAGGVVGSSEEFVFFGPDHRESLEGAGLSKDDIRNFLHEHSGRRAGDIDAARTPDDPRSRESILGEKTGLKADDWISTFESAADIHVVAAGGSGGNGSIICTGQPGLAWGRHGTSLIRNATTA